MTWFILHSVKVQAGVEVIVQWMVTWTKLNQKTKIHILFQPSHHQSTPKPTVMAFVPKRNHSNKDLVRHEGNICSLACDIRLKLWVGWWCHTVPFTSGRVGPWQNIGNWWECTFHHLMPLWRRFRKARNNSDLHKDASLCCFLEFFCIYFPSNCTFWLTLHAARQWRDKIIPTQGPINQAREAAQDKLKRPEFWVLEHSFLLQELSQM